MGDPTRVANVRIMLVDDHRVVRDGLAAILEREPGFQVVASVGNGERALADLDEAAPDIVLLDLRMPGMDGIKTLRLLQEKRPHLPVLMLSGHAGDESVFQALREGARGYLLKDIPATDLVASVRKSLSGKIRPAPALAERLAQRLFEGGNLSAREIEVLEHVALGESNRDIGQALGLSEHTIKNHLRRILEKLSAADRTEAVTIAIRRGLLTVDE